MTRKLTDKEFAAVSALPGPKRYSHFVKQVADWEQVWSLRNVDGWVTSEDDNGRRTLPVWPHPRYAEACASNEWSGTAPASIVLTDWIEKWLPGMRADGLHVAVFPVSPEKSVVVSPDRLLHDLEIE